MDAEKQKTWDALSLPGEMVYVDGKYDDLLTLDEFLECVRDGAFIDDDGFGNWATATKKLPGWIDGGVSPSRVSSGQSVPPAWATHVVWYNK